MNLRDNVAVVTGASMGIGRAIGLALAREGAQVVGTARGEPELESFFEEVRPVSPGSSVFSTDVSDPQAVAGLFETVSERYARVDLLVNNAGLEDRRSILETTREDVDRLMSVNFGGVVNSSLAVIPDMVSRGSGRIVNVVSAAGRSPIGREPAYCASKAAITAFSESISYELEPLGVRVQVLYPGYVGGTRMAREAARAGQRTPPKLVQRTPEQAAAALLAGLNSSSFEINSARLETLAPLVRSVAPRLYRRQIERTQPSDR